jgi:hypothetical protein
VGLGPNEYEDEPVRGLPEELPEGEEILWQGEPCWKSLARRVFHVQRLGLYFALLIGGHLAYRVSDQGLAAISFGTLAWQVGLTVFTLGLLAFMGWLYGRTTVYTITNRRIVLRFGVALPMMINLPLARVRSADLRLMKEGTGDVVLHLAEGDRISYMAIWPHAKPWHYAPVLPALRCLERPQEVAAVLASAVAESGDVRFGEAIEEERPVRHAAPLEGVPA